MQSSQEASDKEFAETLALIHKARVIVSVRGTDKNPVVECYNKTGKGNRRGFVVGGIELKWRLQRG